jgi:seryl-tRNA synthetase
MEDLDLVDFDSASDVSGSKFYYLKNAAAMLELALVNYTMQVLSDDHLACQLDSCLSFLCIHTCSWRS